MKAKTKMTEEELNKYLDDNMKYYYYKEEKEQGYFIHHNLPMLHKSLEIMNDYINNFDLKNIETIKTSYFSKMNLFKKIDLLEDFFNKMKIDIDVQKLIMDGTIDTNYLQSDYYRVKKYFSAYFSNSGKHKKVKFPNSNLALDFIVMAHELAHFYNDAKEDDEQSILTEAYALYVEKMAGIYLKNKGYNFEYSFFNEVRLENIRDCINDSISQVEAKLTYITFGKITKENYHKLFNDKDYNKFLNTINEKEFYKITISLRYVFGYMLANYMSRCAANDYSFIQNINNFGKKMNKLSFDDCLKELNINGMDDFFEKAINSLEDDLMIRSKTK